MNVGDKIPVHTNSKNTFRVDKEKENFSTEILSANQNPNSYVQKKHIAQKLINSFEIALGKEETVKETENEYKIAKTGNPKEDKYDDIILKVAQKYDVDPNLIKAVIKKESVFNPKAVSHVKAKGLMQLRNITIKEIERISGFKVKDPFDPQQNIEGGTIYLSYLLRRYKGNLDLALAAYNAGPENVSKTKGIPQNRETPDYIKKVKMYYEEYTKMIKK